METNVAEGKAGLIADGQKAKGFAFKTVDGSAMIDNKPTQGQVRRKMTECEIYEEIRRLPRKTDKGRKVDGAVVTKTDKGRSMVQ